MSQRLWSLAFFRIQVYFNLILCFSFLSHFLHAFSIPQITGLLIVMQVFEIINNNYVKSNTLFCRDQFSSVQSLSSVWLFATPWITACQAFLYITNSRSLLTLMSIELVMPSSHLIFCHPLLLLPPIPPSIRVFSTESALCMRWPKYWNFSFSISPSDEHPGLIFRLDWLDLLAVQGTLKNLVQHHSSKASIFQHSAFFTVQLSHPYVTTGKTIALTRQTLLAKQCLCFLICYLSMLVITFLPRSKHLLISWL